MIPRRPLRSILIGDVDGYPSEYIFGVNQGMTLLGHFHNTVNVRQDIGLIAKRVAQVHPDVIWGHMLLWPPGSMAKAAELLDLCARWRQRGARVIMHDGDARTETRHPTDISRAVDVVLCNHTADRSVWGINQVRWPYFAFAQTVMADPCAEFSCDLAFAGRISESGIYAGRTRLVAALRDRLGDRFRVFPNESVPHTLMRTPELAASASAILGYGRPEAPGWLDVRLFQYLGAGGVLLYDDVNQAEEFLIPHRHFVPYVKDDPDSVEQALEEAKRWSWSDRENVRVYVQQWHSSVSRVQRALREVGLV